MIRKTFAFLLFLNLTCCAQDVPAEDRVKSGIKTPPKATSVAEDSANKVANLSSDITEKAQKNEPKSQRITENEPELTPETKAAFVDALKVDPLSLQAQFEEAKKLREEKAKAFRLAEETARKAGAEVTSKQIADYLAKMREVVALDMKMKKLSEEYNTIQTKLGSTLPKVVSELEKK